MKRFKIVLTEKQLDTVTSALFEYEGTCWDDSDLRAGPNYNMVKLARSLKKIRHSIIDQQNKILDSKSKLFLQHLGKNITMTTPKEIKKYFAKIGAKGGKAKSKKKTQASKENGLSGGRPKKKG